MATDMQTQHSKMAANMQTHHAGQSEMITAALTLMFSDCGISAVSQRTGLPVALPSNVVLIATEGLCPSSDQTVETHRQEQLNLLPKHNHEYKMQESDISMQIRIEIQQ